MQISDAHGPPVYVKHKLCLECLQISSRLTYQWKSSDFDATGDERLENGGGVDILYPHICIVSAYRVAPQPPSAGPLGFVPGFFTRGGFFIQALVSSRRQLVWMKSSGNPPNYSANTKPGQGHLSSTVWITTIEGQSQCPLSRGHQSCHRFIFQNKNATVFILFDSMKPVWEDSSLWLNFVGFL